MSPSSLTDALAGGAPFVSFEFFPPKTDEGEQQLWQAISELEPLRPAFVSVTYGAGGSTRDRTVRITGRIAAETSLTPVAHLTCVGSTREELAGIVADYANVGVRNILALRGDPPGGLNQPWTPTEGGLNHADELVELIHGVGDFTVAVAAFPDGHPESADRDADAAVLKAKQDAGAEVAITQFFFRASSYFDLVARARAAGCTMPIIPGIIPVTNPSQIARFTELMGTEFPEELAQRFRDAGDDPEAVSALGVEVAADLCRELLDGGAPGLHFFTLNRSTASRQVYAELGLAVSGS